MTKKVKQMPLDDSLYAEEWAVGDIKEGTIVRDRSLTQEDKEIRPLRLKHMRICIQKLNDLYQSGKIPTKEDIDQAFDQLERYGSNELNDALDQLERGENFFKVEERKVAKDGTISFKLKKLDSEERIKMIKRIAKALVNKLSKKELASLMEEGIRKNANNQDIEEIDKELKTKKPKVKAYKGCFKVMVNDKEIMVFR